MSCEERVLRALAMRRNNQRIDREIEALRRSLYNGVQLPTDVLNTLFASNLSGKVDVIVASDRHSFEVRQDGRIQVVQLTDLLTLGTSGSLLQNINQDASNRPLSALNPARPVLRDILRSEVRPDGTGQEPQGIQARLSR
jgi:hypothetical protein